MDNIDEYEFIVKNENIMNGRLNLSSLGLTKFIISDEVTKRIFNISCHNNFLMELPKLPDTIHSLICFKNRLKKLPELPISIIEINCSFNNLKELPNMKNLDNLLSIWCNNNELESLPSLPVNLKYLYCYNNPLKTLPELPDGLIKLVMSIDQTDLLQNDKFINYINKNDKLILVIVDSYEKINLIPQGIEGEILYNKNIKRLTEQNLKNRVKFIMNNYINEVKKINNIKLSEKNPLKRLSVDTVNEIMKYGGIKKIRKYKKTKKYRKKNKYTIKK